MSVRRNDGAKGKTCVRLTAHLGLPDGVAHAPQSRYGEEQLGVVGMWPPDDEDPYERGMDDETERHQRHASDVLHYGAEE